MATGKTIALTRQTFVGKVIPLLLNMLSRLQTMSRQSHRKQAPDFHDKYGKAVLANGATFCVARWAYQFITPKEWRNQ
ncbi:hypothetical protein JEQ12_013655 [Ovis aries]|uniref:Cytochrome c oxidase subunit 7B, mitochondrial n=1 Tax=Ovis aries TaxID=9940 RepID=A0A836A6K8_SHEEP|nr:hypothetical protein JEQ12_013655 [Ovis aries]